MNIRIVWFTIFALIVFGFYLSFSKDILPDYSEREQTANVVEIKSTSTEKILNTEINTGTTTVPVKI